jgi:hypothetical protein
MNRTRLVGGRIAAFSVSLFLLGCSRGLITEHAWINTLPKPWQLTEEEISFLLPQFYEHYPNFEDRLKAFALWRVGTPYEIYKLGDEVEPDPDPLIRLDVSDCTGHVLTSLACVQAHSWEEARQNMIEIHYKADSVGRKVPSYLSRWHYTADRITANPYTVDITPEVVPKSELDSVIITLNRGEDGSEFLELGWSRKLTVHYIPSGQIDRELLKKLPAVCGVAFVRKSYFKMGLVIAHEGMIIDNKDLIHASQSAGRTVKLDFLKYYFQENGPLFDGIMVYRFVPFDAVASTTSG